MHACSSGKGRYFAQWRNERPPLGGPPQTVVFRQLWPTVRGGQRTRQHDARLMSASAYTFKSKGASGLIGVDDGRSARNFAGPSRCEAFPSGDIECLAWQARHSAGFQSNLAAMGQTGRAVRLVWTRISRRQPSNNWRSSPGLLQRNLLRSRFVFARIVSSSRLGNRASQSGPGVR